MRTAIIICSKTGALLEGCLGALKMTTPGIDTGEVGVLVVANGDDKARAEVDVVVRAFRGACPPAAQIHGIPDDQGDFYGNWCHAGAFRARELQATRLVFLNDDAYAQSFWLEALDLDMDGLVAAKYKPGLLGCRGNQISGPQNVFNPTEIAMRQKVPEIQRDPLLLCDHPPVAFPWPRIVTFAAMVRTEDYFLSGGFDLTLPAHNYSDDILSYRFLKAGFQNWVSGAFVAHLGSRTVAGGLTVAEARAAFERGQVDMKAGEEHYLRTCPDAEAVRKAAFKAAGYPV